MFAVCVTSWVKPDYVEPYVEACKENARQTRLEPGNLRFDLLQSSESENQFFFYEVYLTEEDFHRHHETDHYKKWRDSVADWLEKPRQGVKHVSLFPDSEPSLWRSGEGSSS